jgi:TolB protein
MSKTTEPARLLALLSAIGLLTGILTGCGGGSGSLSSGAGMTGSGMGRAVFTIVWPPRSRLIPLASNSLKITVTQGTNTLSSKVVPRPAQGGHASAEFDALPVGALAATAIAYPQTDATGMPQAQATAPLTIQAGKTADITLSMASTIQSLQIYPVTVTAGQSATLSVTPKDSLGRIILIDPSNLKYTPQNPAIATINASGTISGVAAGTTQISILENEANISGVATITVEAASATSGLISAGNLVFTRNYTDLFKINLDGTGETRLTRNDGINFNGSVSPDGTKIVFNSTRDGNDEVYIMNADGSSQLRLTSSPGADAEPDFTASGKIVFFSERDGIRQIYVMNADGTGQTRVTHSAVKDAFPHARLDL